MNFCQRFCFLFLLYGGFMLFAHAQKPNATLQGKLTNPQNQPITGVHIFLKPNLQQGTYSDSTGFFRFKVPVGEHQIQISHISYLKEEKTISLQSGEIQTLNLILIPKSRTLGEVAVESDTEEERHEVSMMRLDPLKIKEIPVPFGDFSQAISMVGLGVSSNNELSASYSVRGGNFDENLVYVNNIEIYRPFLIRAGQQEGLSFINPDFVEEVEFSAGGWQPKFGDKLSSVLNITYKTPQKFDASATVSLLGGRAFLEGTTKNQRIGWLLGFRNKSARYLFSTLETNGEYLPQFSDFQGLLNFNLTPKTRQNLGLNTNLSVLLSYARNRYLVRPQSRETDYGTFNQVVRLYVEFYGQENLNFDTQQIGLKLSHDFSEKFTSNFIFSALQTAEREYVDTEGAYALCDVDTDLNSKDFNKCAVVRGAGTLGDYARNALDAQIFALESRNHWKITDNQSIEFGVRWTNENITDQIQQYSFEDSSDYVKITERLFTDLTLNSQRFSGYAQHSLFFGKHTLTYGARLGYWNINEQWIFSPRLQYAFAPEWQQDIIFNFAIGVFQQPPFYRELRDFQGNLNRNLRAQTSYHFIAGADYNFEMWGRPFKIISEAYYKKLENVIPYDIDNVRVRYYAKNNAIAYVTGLDFRWSGEFVKDTESWFSLSLLSTQEDWTNDEKGWVRRPTDQRATLAIYYEDYIPSKPNLRMNLRIMYGTGLPFGPPNQPQYRSVLSGDTYRRVDIGFSKFIEPKTPKKAFESLRLSVEILNILGANNVISYLWISDFLENQYAVPNGLSQRFFNLKITGKF